MSRCMLLDAEPLGLEDRGVLLRLMRSYECCNLDKNGGGLFRSLDLFCLCGNNLGDITLGSRLYKRLSRRFNHFSNWNFNLALDLFSSSFALVGYRDSADGSKLNLTMEQFHRVCENLVLRAGEVSYESLGTFGVHFSCSSRYGFLSRGRHKTELIKSYFNNKLR